MRGLVQQPGTSVPSRPNATVVLVLLLAAITLSHADRHVFSVLIPAIKAEFGVSDSVMGLIAGPGFFLSYVLFSVPLARLADRWSRTRVISLSVAVWSVAAALCGLVGNAVQLALARVMVGVGEAGGFPPAQSLVSDLFNKAKRSGALGIINSGTYLGLVLGLAGGAAIAEVWGWRAAFLALALPGLPLAIAIWFFTPRRGQLATAPQLAPPGDTLWRSLAFCWSVRSLRLSALAMGLFNMFGYAGAIWMPTYFMRSHGMSVLEAGTWLGVASAIGGVAGSLAGGKVVDWLVPRDVRWQLRVPALGLFGAFPVVIIMLLIPGGATLTLGRLDIAVVALLSVVSTFFASVWAAPVYGSVALVVPPHRRGQAAAVITVVINLLGSVAGPLIAGVVSDLLISRAGVDSIRYSLLLMSLLTLGGAVLFLRAARHLPTDIIADDPGPPRVPRAA